MKLVFFLLLFSLFGNEPSKKEIPYRQLTWSDYQGAIPENEPDVAARTMTQLALETTEADGKFHFVATAYFLPDSSFVREPTDENLRHEQTHFKIAYIQAQKYMRALEPLQGGDSLDRAMALTLFDHFYDDGSQIQDQFDRESRHGRNREVEKRWEARISNEMLIFGIPSKPPHGRNRKNP